ncbi:MAG: hypothetical protein ACOCUV_02070 [bacterium]
MLRKAPRFLAAARYQPWQYDTYLIIKQETDNSETIIMRKKNSMIFILIISAIVFSTGIYFKFIKSYSKERLQVETTNLGGEKFQRQLKLGEMISMLKKLESIEEEYEIDSDENDIALKKLRTIDVLSIFAVILGYFSFFWSIQKLRKKTFL